MTESLSEAAYRHISHKLVNGTLKAGQKISEKIIAQECNISRTPVREAIRRMTDEGLLYQIPSSGTYVAKPDRRQIIDALLILQLEGTNVAEYEKIATLSGIDILFIGPYDLSQGLGIPGQIDDVRVLEKIREIIAIAKHNDKVVGVFADTPEQAKRWVDAGVQYLAYSVDLGLFYDKCLGTVKTLRQL